MANAKDKKAGQAVAPPGRKAAIALIVIAAVGLLLAAELTRIYVKVRVDPGFKSACAINQEYNCLTAAQSRYSALYGVPTSVIGLGGYLAIIAAAALSLGKNPRRRDASLILAIALTGFAAATGIYLFIVSKFVIHVVCPYCMGTYAVNLAAFIAAVISARAGGNFSGRALALIKEPAALILGGAPASGLALLALLVPLLAFRLVYGDLTTKVPKVGNAPVGISEDGHPWIGATSPIVVISEFSDYQCPHCRKVHADNRAVLAKYWDKVRLVHRHLPLDNACHPMVKTPMHKCACLFAAYAACAQEQGAEAFWRMNDYLFALPHEGGCPDPAAAARAASIDAAAFNRCLESPLPASRVEADIQESLKLSILATPTLVVDGNSLPYSELDDRMVEQLIHIEEKKAR